MRLFGSLRSLVWALPLVSSLVGMGCGAPAGDELSNDDGELSADGKADGYDSTYTYYSVRHDTRRCVAPLCGGYWVKKVNSNAAEKYVAEMSFTKAGLDEYDLQTISVAGSIVRGWVNQKTFGSFGKLNVFAASEVWAAGSANPSPTGTYYRLTDKNFVCAKAPCFNIGEAKLNDNDRATLSGLGGKLAGDAGTALFEDDKLIVAGSNQKDRQTGYTKDGKIVVVSEYFRRVKHYTGSTCANVKCTADTQCEMIDVVCITAPCYPVPQCVLTDEKLVSLATAYGFPNGNEENERKYFTSEAEAYAYANTATDGLTWVANTGARNSFVWGINDLWAVRFEIDRITGDITITAEH